MTFEGVQLQGAAKIMEKIQSLTFQKIAHLITAVDCQPSFDGGVLINVLGQLKVRKMTNSFKSWRIIHIIDLRGRLSKLQNSFLNRLIF